MCVCVIFQERDARLETKRRNERSSISFAFGSSTPRLLDPVEVSLISPSGSYWGHRRSTSISNVSYSGGTGAPLSRRSSERELADGPKKRATSAGGLDRPEGKRNSNYCSHGAKNRTIFRYFIFSVPFDHTKFDFIISFLISFFLHFFFKFY